VRREEARDLLGVTGDDPEQIRAAYRRRLRAVHPDLNPSPDAAEATHLLTLAYRALIDPSPREPRSPRSASTPASRPGAAPSPAPSNPRRSGPALAARVLDDSTVSVRAARDEVLDALVDAADALGELVYLDSHAGILEVLVEFVDEPTCNLTMSMQGRADGTVEVFCGVEPLSGGTGPPLDAVTRLVAATLAAASG
jgi:hypothetical protein